MIEAVDIVVAQRAGAQAVVKLLRQVHRDAVNSDLQNDHAPCGQSGFAMIRPHARPRDPQDRREWAVALRQRQHSVKPARPRSGLRPHILDTDVKHIHLGCAFIRLESHFRVDRKTRKLLLLSRPECIEILRIGLRRRNLVRSESRGRHAAVVFPLKLHAHLATNEARLAHRAAVKRDAAVLQQNGLLLRRHHLGTDGVTQRRAREAFSIGRGIDAKPRRLAQAVRPSGTIGLHAHLDSRRARHRRSRHGKLDAGKTQTGEEEETRENKQGPVHPPRPTETRAEKRAQNSRTPERPQVRLILEGPPPVWTV